MAKRPRTPATPSPLVWVTRHESNPNSFHPDYDCMMVASYRADYIEVPRYLVEKAGLPKCGRGCKEHP